MVASAPLSTLLLYIITALALSIPLLATVLSSEDDKEDGEDYDSDSDQQRQTWVPFSLSSLCKPYLRCLCAIPRSFFAVFRFLLQKIWQLLSTVCCKSRKEGVYHQLDLDVEIPKWWKTPPQTEGLGVIPQHHEQMPPPHLKSTPQLLSDVDDTFICSGAGWKGGTDTRFISHVVYPGAPQFYLALSRGKTDTVDPEGVIWMSARAAHTPIIKLFAGKIDNTHPVGKALIEEGRCVGVPGFGSKGGLYGKFSHNIRFSRTTRNALKGEHKYYNFVKYMKATPFLLPKSKQSSAQTMSRSSSGIALAEMVSSEPDRRPLWSSCECPTLSLTEEGTTTGPFVFIGDNGEGDELTAIRLLQEYPDRVAACFVHDVTGCRFGRTAEADMLVRQGKLFYFTTYLGAALQAEGAQLLSRDSLRRVYEAIVSSAFMSSVHLVQAARHVEHGKGEGLGDVETDSRCGKDFHLWCDQITNDIRAYNDRCKLVRDHRITV